MAKLKKNPLQESNESELLLIGRALQSEKDRKILLENLSQADFASPVYQLLYNTLKELNAKGSPCDIHLVANLLKSRKQLEKVGGVAFLTEIVQQTTWAVNIDDYISILKEGIARKKALELLRSNALFLSTQPEKVSDVLDRLSGNLNRISQEISKSDVRSIKDVSFGEHPKGDRRFLKNLQKRISYFEEHKKPYVDGVSSGYVDLDSLIGGFCNSNFIILAARPGMGKTALALNFLINVAGKGTPVGIASLEMTNQQLYERLISKESAITSEKIREGSVKKEEWAFIEAADLALSEMPIFFLEGGCFISDLVSKIRRLKEEKNISFFIIDYLQLIQGSAETRLQEISNITRALKNLSIELNIPILCLSQLSRKVEDRTDKKPQLSDLRESGTIEQDADSVLMIMCPDYYDPHHRIGEADIYVAKNRHGKTGKVTLQYSKELSRFKNLQKMSGGESGYF